MVTTRDEVDPIWSVTSSQKTCAWARHARRVVKNCKTVVFMGIWFDVNIRVNYYTASAAFNPSGES